MLQIDIKCTIDSAIVAVQLKNLICFHCLLELNCLSEPGLVISLNSKLVFCFTVRPFHSSIICKQGRNKLHPSVCLCFWLCLCLCLCLSLCLWLYLSVCLCLSILLFLSLSLSLSLSFIPPLFLSFFFQLLLKLLSHLERCYWRCHNIQHNDTHPKNTQQNNI
jgi:hypothetical protein